MDIRPIRSEADYEAALDEIDRLMDAAPDSPEGERLDVLTTLVERYEARHHPIDPPDPVVALQHAMEQRGISRDDLVPLLGSRAVVADILDRKRRLTMEMAWRLHRELGLPAEALIKPYELAGVDHDRVS